MCAQCVRHVCVTCAQCVHNVCARVCKIVTSKTCRCLFDGKECGSAMELFDYIRSKHVEARSFFPLLFFPVPR